MTSTTTEIPSRHQSRGQEWYRAIVAFRAIWTVLFVFGLNAVMPLGTSPWLVTATAVGGVVIASQLARSALNWRGFIALLAALWIVDWVFFWIGDNSFGGMFPRYFTLDRFKLHTEASLAALTITAVCTWVFWRVRFAITLETIAFSGICIVLFAGHRNFHLDRPKIINSLAWELRVDHLAMLMSIGAALLVAGFLYLYLASQAVRPQIDRLSVRRSTAGRNWVTATCLLALITTLLYGVFLALYNHFNSIMLARVANGVGMNSENGVSPLSFQSALGSSNQPAALVRLEGDYPYNPFSPMMYMRESALSGFNGHELVYSGKAYDTDLPATNPAEAFTGKEDIELIERTPLVQSVYLLADHQNAFAVDYPLSIVQLKNPRPNRFKNAYRAYSSAPGFKLTDLSQASVGDPRWNAEVLAHYLKEHQDPRYKELAVKLTENATAPIEKVLAITSYLSRTAIYTLTPNHDTKPEEDQVAPFLFGDHRGYCVHFAHAIVYMLRSIGIPSRIGTGYLTDLSQSKDGHILLRMSDRHAWAEVYIAQHGWVPFDVQPDHVENHADSQVDSKLLEDLMGILEPGEEILPPETAKDEPGMQEPSEPWVPSKKLIGGIAITLVVFLILFKVILLSAWRFVSSRRLKVQLGYISAASALCDAGIVRSFGETRSEFAARIPNGALSDLTHLVLESTYAPESKLATRSGDGIAEAVAKARGPIRAAPWWKRVWATLNLASVLRVLGGSKW